MDRAQRFFHGILGESELHFPLCRTGLMTLIFWELWGAGAVSEVVFLITQSPTSPHHPGAASYCGHTQIQFWFQQVCLILAIMDTKPVCTEAAVFSKYFAHLSNKPLNLFLCPLFFPSFFLLHLEGRKDISELYSVASYTAVLCSSTQTLWFTSDVA